MKCFTFSEGGFVMKKEKRIIQVIIKSGLITWVLLLLIWQTGSLFYSDDFSPTPNQIRNSVIKPIAGTNRKKFKNGSKIAPIFLKCPMQSPAGIANNIPSSQPFMQ